MSKIGFFSLITLVAGSFSSCSHPVSPPPPVTISDSVTIAGPKVGYVKDSITFTAHINFSPTPGPLFRWTFTDTTLVRHDSNITRIFADSGQEIFRVAVLRAADSVTLCSATDTILILDTTHHDTIVKPPPSDTTSHNFTWTEFNNVGNENNMTGCWVFGPNCILANNSYMYEWNGSTWQRLNLYSPDPQIGKNINGSLSGYSIFGFDTNNYWMTDGSVLYHYDGNGIALTYRVYYLSHSAIHSAWGTSSNDMYFVGDSGTILHFDGTNWTKMVTPSIKELNSIWGTADNNIYAAGYNISTGETEVLHYDGSSWSKDVLSTSGIAQNWGINWVYASDSAGHETVAASGWTVFRRTDQGPWRSDSGMVPNNIGGNIWMGIYGNGSNDLLGAGDGGMVMHWSGHTWKRYDQFLSVGDNNYLHNSASIKGNTACIVGVKDGTSWVLVGQR